MEYTIRVGGEAGKGVRSVGGTLARLLKRHGFYVFTHQDYMSRIRGGHNFYQIRFADTPVSSSRDSIDLLIALDRLTVDLHRQDLNRKGNVLCDATTHGIGDSQPDLLDVPLARIVEEKQADPIMVNSAVVGAVMGMFGLQIPLFEALMREGMTAGGEGVVATHTSVAQAGFDYYVDHFLVAESLTPDTVPPPSRMFINGNQAIGLGALYSGCRFFSAYPMTPSTSIMNYLGTKAEKYGIIVEQAEDELAAINMALGASYGGVRSMTATSGGGFSLMNEGLSLAGMTETPVVIAEAQRPGPATGLPTRTEQGDLLAVLFGGHGEFLRVVLAPGTPEQALQLTNKAFHLAEKYQIPTIVLTDQYLADSEWTVAKFDLTRLQREDFRLRESALQAITSYKRYRLNDTGVSPLAGPGLSKHLVAVDSDEHDEDGHIIEDSETRIAMVRKRGERKAALLRREIDPPLYLGDDRPAVVLIGFGSTFGVLQEAMPRLAGGHRTGHLHFTELWPFPLAEKFDFIALLNQAKLTVCVENNATSQFAQLLRMETGHECRVRINKFDGRPFLLDSLVGEINGHLQRL